MSAHPDAATAPARLDEIYRRRAAQLAKPRGVDARVRTVPVLVFGLGQERFAIELNDVSEVVPYRGCTPIPGARAGLAGVVNLRGDLRAVVDLRSVLGPAAPGEAPAAQTGYVLMLRRTGRAIGFRIDRIGDVRHVDPAQLVPSAGAALPVPGLRFIKTVTSDTVMVIDTDAALSHFDPANA